MTMPDLVLYDEEFRKIKDSLNRLAADANANVVFLVDKNGQQIAAVGDLTTLDTTSLASLTAGNVAATDGLARLIGEREFSILFHEGERDNIHISIVAQRVILVVIFDERTSLGLVRLRVRRAMAELEKIFADIAGKAEREKQSLQADFDSPFAALELRVNPRPNARQILRRDRGISGGFIRMIQRGTKLGAPFVRPLLTLRGRAGGGGVG